MKKFLPLVCLLSFLAGCSKSPAPSSAYKVTSRTQLIGGKRALGEIGDYKLSNGIIHAVIQDVGYSRGFGAFGGSLIDIDLVRATKATATQGPVGNDYFTEMFPAFFLEAIEPSKVEVLADGSDGNAAIIRVSGEGGDFLSLVKSINTLLIPPVKMAYQVDYILEPGKQYLKIAVTLTNIDTKEAQFPLSIPFGFITLLGEGQRLFVPGEGGFDLRFYLPDVVYKRDTKLEALPGAVSSMWATEGSGVSYAVAASPKGSGYMAANPTFYPGAKPDSLFIPVAYSSFLGSFWAKPPAVIPPKKGFTYTAYLSVGSGDVATAQKVIYGVADEGGRQPTKIGTLTGRVTEAGTGMRLGNISVVIQDDAGNYVSQARTLDGSGVFTAPVPPGNYHVIATDGLRDTVTSTGFVAVAENGSAEIDVSMSRPAALEVSVTDDQGRALPAKISVEGTYDHTGAEPPRKFLYDLKVGDRYKISDMDPDTADANSRRYLERILFAPSGTVGKAIKPGHYKVYASRGIEYTLESKEIDLVAGQTGKLQLQLKHVMTTPGWASGDFHVHSTNSVDSDMALDDRVASYAVEGVDLVTSTDHNFISDFGPTVEQLGLRDWLHSTVGLELTSLEMGHFNAFPILLSPGPVTHGSFRWFRRPPGELFAQLRGLGKDPQATVVQVNHPRDSVLGYFNAFNLSTYSASPLPPSSAFVLDQSPLEDGGTSPYHPSNFSLDFDALEVFNGKRNELLFTYRVPEDAGTEGADPTLPFCSGGKIADCIPGPGEVLHLSVNVADAGEAPRTVLQPAFPGAIDDWYTLLSQGQHLTATGNSDSHSAAAEAGLPRTYMNVGATADGSMRGLSEPAAMAAIRSGDVVVTNGPFITATVNGVGLGQEVVAPDGTIELKLQVQAAPWVDVKRVVVRRGGRDQVQRPDTLDTFDVPDSQEVIRFEKTKSYTNIPDNSFLVIEVYGDKPMWPVFTPYEIPSIQISDAIGVIGSSFGYGNKYGRYKPSPVNQVTPFGFTNPIWIDRSKKQGLARVKPVLPVSNSEPFVPRKIPDVRRIFLNFHADPGGD